MTPAVLTGSGALVVPKTKNPPKRVLDA